MFHWAWAGTTSCATATVFGRWVLFTFFANLNPQSSFMQQCLLPTLSMLQSQVILEHPDFANFAALPGESSPAPTFTYIKVFRNHDERDKCCKTSYIWTFCEILSLKIWFSLKLNPFPIQPPTSQKFVIVLDVSNSMQDPDDPVTPQQRLPR